MSEREINPTMDEALDHVEAHRLSNAAIRELRRLPTTEQRKVVAIVNAPTWAEAARSTGEPVTRVRSRMHRFAAAMLRRTP